MFLRRVSLGLRVLVVIGALPAVALGCSGCQGRSEGITPSSLHSAQVKAVLSAAVVDDRLRVAVDTVDNNCLRDHGLHPPAVTPRRASTSVNLSGVIGVFDSVSDARANSYSRFVGRAKLPGRPAVVSEPDYDRIEFGLDVKPVHFRASSSVNLSAVPSGCFGKSIEAVYGSMRNYLIVTSLQPVMAEQPVASEDLLVPIYSDYSSCMRRAGYVTASLRDTLSLVTSKYPSSNGAAPGERSLAVADATCQQQVHLLERCNNAYLATNERWIASHFSYFKQVAQIITEANIRAGKL